MSYSGPAPSWKRNAGLGCQDSGPGDWNRVRALAGAPIAPSRRVRSAVWMPAPSTVSGAPPTRTPASSAAASRAFASAGAVVIGFSVHTCLPAATIARETSAWAVGIVRLTTISTSGWSSTSWAVPEAGTRNSAARAAAASGNRSPTMCTTRSGNEVRWVRYSAEMVPAPMSPTPTGPVEVWEVMEVSFAGCGVTGRGGPVGRAAGSERGAQMGDRGLDALEHVPGVVVDLDHAVGDVGGGPQCLGQGHRPGAEGELGGGVLGQVAVLEVDQLHALAEALEQGRHVGAADRGPVGVDLEDHPGIQLLGEHLAGGAAVQLRGEPAVRVAVAHADPRLGGGLGPPVERPGQGADRRGVGPVRGVPERVHQVLHADGLGGLEHGREIHLAEERLVGAGERDRELLAGPHQLVAVLQQVVGLGVGQAEVDQAGQSGLDIVRERLAHAVQLDGDLHRGPFGEGNGGHFTAPAVRPATKFFCIIRKP